MPSRPARASPSARSERERVRAHAVVAAPATLGNFGPGFDVTSLALHGIGDTVTLGEASEDAIEVSGAGAEKVPKAWSANVAGAAIDALRKATGCTARFRLRIAKGQPPGSGLGSSASSAGGAALAFHALFGPRYALRAEQLVDAAAWGEAAAAGRHFDDVGAVVQGGLSIVRPPERPGDLPTLSRLAPPEGLTVALCLPDVTLSTHDMRQVLPTQYSRADLVSNMAQLALLVDAFARGDVAAVGRALEDKVATPYRGPKVPGFRRAKEAARASGAHGFGVGGSGPAMFAVCSDPRTADAVAKAMREAVVAGGIPARGFTAIPETEVMHRAVLLPRVRPPL